MNRNLPNIKNDNCYIEQYNRDNDIPLNYMLYGGKYENSNLNCFVFSQECYYMIYSNLNN